MEKIDHNTAVAIENEIRNLYGCDRYGIFGFANADIIETNPETAISLIASYAYLHRLDSNEAINESLEICLNSTYDDNSDANVLLKAIHKAVNLIITEENR